jgi:hypothetical protein
VEFESIDPAPRGKRQKERFYLDHVAPGEELFVVILGSGDAERYGKMNGKIVVADSVAPLRRLEAQYRPAMAPEWTIERRALPPGLRIERIVIRST